MKQVFPTSVGTVEVHLYGDDGMISASRFDAGGRVTAAAIESWDHPDLTDLLSRQLGVPRTETRSIVGTVRRDLPSPSFAQRVREAEREGLVGSLDYAGVPRRFVALLLDSLIVLLPLSIVVGLMMGGGYAERGDGYTNVGVNVTGRAYLLFTAMGITYFVFGEALTGATLGKRMMRIRVVDEHGRHPTFGAAVRRNIFRIVDGLFFYLVGAILALASPRRQRLGDRVAHTVVIRN